MGLIYGDYGGRSDEFAPGGFSFENGFCPHGGAYTLLPPGELLFPSDWFLV